MPVLQGHLFVAVAISKGGHEATEKATALHFDNAVAAILQSMHITDELGQ